MFEPTVPSLEVRCPRIFFSKSLQHHWVLDPFSDSLGKAANGATWLETCHGRWWLSVVRDWIPPQATRIRALKQMMFQNLYTCRNLDCENLQVSRAFLKNAFENEHATKVMQMFFLCCAIPMAPRIAVKTTIWPNVSMASPSGKIKVYVSASKTKNSYKTSAIWGVLFSSLKCLIDTFHVIIPPGCKQPTPRA